MTKLNSIHLFETYLAANVLKHFLPLMENGDKIEVRETGPGVALFAREKFIFGIPEPDLNLLAQRIVESLLRPPLTEDDVQSQELFEDAYCTVTEALLRLKARGLVITADSLTKAARAGRIEGVNRAGIWLLDKISLDAYTPRSYNGNGGRKYAPNPTGRNGRKKIENTPSVR